MTIHKLTAGDGYTYLTRQVAGGDVEWERGQAAAEYYTAKGNPPGRWMGRGAPLLGLDGELVTEEQMQALFGAGMHPNADAVVSEYLAEHVRAGMTDRQLEVLQDKALKAATLGARFPVYEPLEQFQSRVARRLETIEAETGRAPTATDAKRVKAEESRRARAAVAGFDVVFAPVKSAALLWALDPRPPVRAAVRQAHEAARDTALQMLEEHAAFTRTGKGGVAQIETRGLVAAVFDHYDSRAGDPNLHTHVAISSKVQGIDGKWRSLDARALYRITVAASEFYNTAFETELRNRIPVTFAERADTVGTREPIREIARVPVEYIEHFSSRRTDIEARYEQLLRAFRREHGRDPDRRTCHQLARQANLDTRDAKKTARSLEEMRTDWTQSLQERFGPGSIARLMDAVPDHLPTATKEPAAQIDVAELAGQVVANVSQMRSTWTIWNLRAEAERLTRSRLEFDASEQHRELVARIVSETLSPQFSVRVDAPAVLDEPQMLRRSDGEPVFAEHASVRYTSRLILDAEDRLLTAARTRTAVGLAGPLVAASLDGFDAQGTRLDPGQRQLVTVFATDERLLVAGLGPAGAGKTTAMRAYAHVAAQAGQRIVALATSSAAADVLGKELGVRADNLHKFLHEYTAGPYGARLRAGDQVPAAARMFALHPGDVVLLDEAGMAGTLALDRLVRIAAERGAVVRLLGDHRQLGAVESGGALRLIATEAGAVELTTLYRFRNPAEADATLKLRIGDTTGLDFYVEAGRIRSGSKQAMIEEAYAAWKSDMLDGKTTLMAAATGVNVTALSAQARLDRVEAGQVEAEGVLLHDGNRAGTGDWITTRHNQRTLRVHGGKDWVKNGDAWSVVARHADGSLTVRHLEHNGSVLLPAPYVAANVELLYATTTNRAQGSTVDTAHPLVTPEMTRENLYVIASRARERTVLHVVTHELLPYDPDDRVDRVRHDARQYAAREVLENILAREGNELPATQAIHQAADHAGSLAALVPRHQHAATLLATERYTRLAFQALARPLAETLTGCDSWPQVISALTDAEAAGWQPDELLAATARDSDLFTTKTPGRLVAWRINAYVQERSPHGVLARPTLADAIRYADLLGPHLPQSDLDPAEATRPPRVRTDQSTARNSRFVSTDTLTHYAAATATALGIPVAQVTAHRCWPHLAGALTAADHSGRDIPGLLETLVPAARAREQQRRIDVVVALARTVRGVVAADPATGPISVPRQLRQACTAAAALGVDVAERLRSDTTWPALDAALHRAEHAGHEPRLMLHRVAEAREYGTADNPSQVLAWRLGRYLRTQPSPRPFNEPTQRSEQEWRLLAWTLKTLENDGADLVQVLNLPQEDALPDVLHRARRAATTIGEGHREQIAKPLPWLTAFGGEESRDHPLSVYLREADALIGNRVRDLTETALTTRPPWSEQLGTAPDEPHECAEWERHLGVVAAYRDQQQIATDDPRQILGPYAEPGRPEHNAYWHAAESVLAARRLAGLEPVRDGTKGLDPVFAQVSADVYLALPEPQRVDVCASMAERLGALWFGERTTVDDHAAVQPGYTNVLHAVLHQQGYLPTIEPPATGDRTAESTPHPRRTDADQPLEAALALQRRARQDAERAARIELARKAHARSQNRRQQQRRRVVPRQEQSVGTQSASPLMRPAQERNQQQERRQSW